MINTKLRSLIWLSLVIAAGLQSCEWPPAPEDKSDADDCYVPNNVVQDTLDIDGESLVWVHNDSIAAHLIIYEPLEDDNINLSARPAVGKQMQQQQPNEPEPTERYSVITYSDTFSLAEIPYSGPLNIYVYSIDVTGRIGSTPVMYARAGCSIITSDVMMLTSPNCTASTIIRGPVLLAPGKLTSVGWSSASDSLYHCTITKGTAITSSFTLKLRTDPLTGARMWSPVSGCSPVNMPSKSGAVYTFTDNATGLRYEVSGNCTGFNIKNTSALGSGKISVTVRRN